jgi:GDSL-like Lipase/Acylhydrolase
LSHSIRIVVSFVFATVSLFAQGAHIMAVGDSLGEGDQSVNAFTLSQQHNYVSYIAKQAQVPLPLPLIQSGKFGVVGSVSGRSRTNASTTPTDLAVSGAKVHDVLNTVANQTPATETDLVLSPYFGLTQIQIVEQVKPGFLFCWVGNDDLINYVLDYQHLNAPSGVTPIASFTSDFQSLMSRLKATGSKVVVGNISDFTKAGYLFDNADLTKYLGTNYNLPAGSYTTFSAFILLKLGQASPAILTDPAYVLTAMQLGRIQNQIKSYNQVISAAAAANGFPVVDTFAVADSIATTPITIEGVTLTNNYNGGAFSLDGIHPSDTGYAIFANAFIKATNTAYGSKIPVLTLNDEIAVLNADPFIDFNGNGIVPGRPNTGLLETSGPNLGISGDTTDIPPGGALSPTISHSTPVSGGSAGATQANPFAFMRAYYTSKGMNPNTAWQKADVERAVSEMLGAPIE